MRPARNPGRQRKRDSITAKLGVINLMRLQRAVTPLSVVVDHLHIHGIVLRGKGTEAETHFFQLGFGRQGDGLRVGDQSGKVGASGGSFRPNIHNTGGFGGPQRGGFRFIGRNLASGC